MFGRGLQCIVATFRTAVSSLSTIGKIVLMYTVNIPVISIAETERDLSGSYTHLDIHT